MEIELPLADSLQNLDIFAKITRKDVDAGDIFFDAVPQKVKPLKSDNRLEGLRFGSVILLGFEPKTHSLEVCYITTF